jgi:hypothetical protein
MNDDTYDNHTCHDNCQRIACVLRRELTAMTEQRDGLQSGIDYASEQLHKVREQRDRLEEALKAIEWSNNSQWQSHCAKVALQSLTPNEL